MKISIITPSFRQLDWLRLCIASVRDQVVAGKLEVEHLVQDPGSPGLEAFARAQDGAYQEGDRVVAPAPPDGPPGYSLKVIREADHGMYDAVNRGLARATGTFCAYLNCDEQYLPATLAYVADWFVRHPTAEVLYGDALVTAPDGAYLCDRKCLVPTELHCLVSGNLAAFTSSTFFRRSLVDRGLLFDPVWRVVGDTAWNLRLLRAGVRRARCGRTLSTFTHTGENLSHRPEARRENTALAALAPAWARRIKPLVLAHYRLRRLLAGAYTLRPHTYAIYTPQSPGRRVTFHVPHPSFRWPEATVKS